MNNLTVPNLRRSARGNVPQHGRGLAWHRFQVHRVGGAAWCKKPELARGQPYFPNAGFDVGK